MRSTLWRLVLLTALLALYPAAMLAFHSFGPARGKPRPVAALEVFAEAAPGEEGRTHLAVWLGLDNQSLESLSLDQVLLTVMREEGAEATLIEDRPALAARSGGSSDLRPNQRLRLGPFLIDLATSPQGRRVQASVTVTPAEGGRAQELHGETTLEVPRPDQPDPS